MPWRPLRSFRDPSVGKIHRLKRAARAGIMVPPTVWQAAAAPGEEALPFPGGPVIVRSAAQDEDTDGGTAAGRYETVVARGSDEFGRALVTVKDSMKGTAGAVFAQPFLRPEFGGVAFFDGFFYERTEALGGNQAITAGTERGTVVRGDLVRGEPWSRWLESLAKVFRQELRGGAALDIEYARDGDDYTLLQARPARFPVKRNPILSLANHREILGDHPSPWIVDALVRAGAGAVDEFVRIDPAIAAWRGEYAEECGGRAWLSFSFFFRLMDHWGLPRTFVTEGVGGASAGPLDRRARFFRMVKKSPRLIRLQLQNRRRMASIPDDLAAFDERLRKARSVADWFDATVFGLDVALRTNFAINGAWSGIHRVRQALGVRGRARVVTEDMMHGYDAIAQLPEGQRKEALDDWLGAFGHRGPLESDPMQPRFAELRDLLEADILGRPRTEGVPEAPSKSAAGWFFRIDVLRERFRDDLMRRWLVLRRGLLGAAQEAVSQGRIAEPDDVFFLDGRTVGDQASWRAAVASARERYDEVHAIQFPLTSRRETLESLTNREVPHPGSQGGGESPGPTDSRLDGIGIGPAAAVRGTVRRADDLAQFLRWLSGEGRGRDDVVLVVAALEPSWAVAFGRVRAVVTEIGGELSHGSILLRESGTPAVVNCQGALAALWDGDPVELDPGTGTVTPLGRG